jgi:hypothetical protein
MALCTGSWDSTLRVSDWANAPQMTMTEFLSLGLGMMKLDCDNSCFIHNAPSSFLFGPWFCPSSICPLISLPYSHPPALLPTHASSQSLQVNCKFFSAGMHFFAALVYILSPYERSAAAQFLSLMFLSLASNPVHIPSRFNSIFLLSAFDGWHDSRAVY